MIWVWKVLIILGMFALPAFLLYRANLKTDSRHNHFPLPPIFFLAIVLLLVLRNRLEGLLNQLEQFLQQLPIADLGLFVDLILVFALSMALALGKGPLRKALSILGRKGKRLSRFSIAYEKSNEGEISLCREWKFPSLIFKYLSFVLLGIFVVALVLCLFEVEQAPLFIAFPLLISLEIYWYLDGPKPLRTLSSTWDGEEVEGAINFFKLWEESQEIWSDKFLVAAFSQYSPNKNRPLESADLPDAQSLINRSIEIDEEDLHHLNMLNGNNDVLFDDVILERFSPLLFTVLLRRLMEGEHILFITSTRAFKNSKFHNQIGEWIDYWITQLSGNKFFWRSQVYNRRQNLDLKGKVIVCAAEDVLEKEMVNHEWFNALSTVVFFDAHSTFKESVLADRTLLNIIAGRKLRVQKIILSDFQFQVQQAMIWNFNMSGLDEPRIYRYLPENCFSVFWALERGEDFQNKLLSGYLGEDLGAEALLCLSGLRESIENLCWVDAEKTPWYEYLEQVANQRAAFKANPISGASIPGDITTKVKVPHVSSLEEVDEEKMILVRDQNFNAIVAFRKWGALASKVGLIHIVSPPYLLRDYFTANYEYFVKTPIHSLVPLRMKSRFDVAFTLLEWMTKEALSGKQIKRILAPIKPGISNVVRELVTIFKSVFDIDIQAANYLEINHENYFNAAKDIFEKRHTFKLSQQIATDLKLAFLQNVKIKQEDETLKVISRDLLFQNYLPHQQVSFDGKPFVIRHFDQDNFIMTANFTEPRKVLRYCPDHEIRLEEVLPPLDASMTHSPGRGIKLALHEVRFKVDTLGYLVFENDIGFHDQDHRYTAFAEREVPTRSYFLGRMLKMSFPNNSAADSGALANTLVLLLKQSLLSFYPNGHQYLHVASNANIQLDINFERLIPKLTNRAEESEFFCIYIFEDAHKDLGLVQSIFENWDYIFKVLADYLYWDHHREGEDQFSTEYLRKQIPASRFIHFGMGRAPEFFRPQECLQLLNNILGTNSLTKQRVAFYSGIEEETNFEPIAPEKKPERKVERKEAQNKSPLPPAPSKFEDVGDIGEGDARLITSEKELQKILQEVKDFVPSEYAIPMKMKALTEFLTKENYRRFKGSNAPRGPKNKYPQLAITAVKGDLYKIMVAKGSPRFLVYASILHELMVIWQHQNLNVKKIKSQHGLYLVEGLAVWVTLQMLESKGLSASYRTDLMEDKGILGSGYRKLKQLVDATGYDGPFELLLKYYPIKEK